MREGAELDELIEGGLRQPQLRDLGGQRGQLLRRDLVNACRDELAWSDGTVAEVLCRADKVADKRGLRTVDAHSDEVVDRDRRDPRCLQRSDVLGGDIMDTRGNQLVRRETAQSGFLQAADIPCVDAVDLELNHLIDSQAR